jgi:integrase
MGKGDGGVYRPKYRDRHGEIKESAIWWIRFSVRRKRFAFSSGTANKSEAQRIKRDKLAEAGRGHVSWLDAERYTFEDLIGLVYTDHALNGKADTCHLDYSFGKLREVFGHSLAMEITADRLEKYAAGRQAGGIAPATVNVELAFLQRAYNLAIKAGRLYTKPAFPFFRVRNARSGFFERPELEAIRDRLPAPLRPAIETAYITGWRLRSEILTRQWQHVDFVGGWLRLEPGEGKTGEPRAFPLLPELRTVLEAQRAYTDQVERERGWIVPWVFHRRGKPIRTMQVSWEKARKEAGLPNRLMHDLRRTAVRNLERAGVSRSAAMAMVGHRSEGVYRRYAIVSEGDLKNGAAKLGTLLQKERGQPAKIEPIAGNLRRTENSS